MDGALAEVQQFLWGGPRLAPAREVEARCLRAREWAADVAGCARNRPSLTQLSSVLAWDPPPVALEGLAQLKEVYEYAMAWKEKYATVTAGAAGTGGAAAAAAASTPASPGAGGGRAGGKEEAGGKVLVSLAALEELAVAAGKLGVELPEVVEVNQRLAAGRQLAAVARDILGALAAEGEGGDAAAAAAGGSQASASQGAARKGGRLPSLAQLRSLQAQMTAARVAVPEAAGLAGLVERVEAAAATGKELARVKAPLEQLRSFITSTADIPVGGRPTGVVLSSSRGSGCDGRAEANALQRALCALRNPCKLPCRYKEVFICVFVGCDALLLQVNLPEVRQVRELVDRAEEWLARLEAARNAEPPPSLKELRQLLHAGAHTAVPYSLHRKRSHFAAPLTRNCTMLLVVLSRSPTVQCLCLTQNMNTMSRVAEFGYT